MSPRTRSRTLRREEPRRNTSTEPRGALRALLASPSKRNWTISLLLAAGTFALYSPVLGYPFIFNYDDDGYVLNNAHVQAGLTWATVKWAVTSTELSNWHPLTWISHALDCQLYGMNPAGHHFSGVLIHCLNVVLLFLLLERVSHAVGRSAMVAALFAVHPFNVESVAWVAERKSVLSTLFFLLTILAYGWYARKPSVKRYGLVAVLCGLALMAKPMVITLPCVLLLLDFWPLRRVRGWGDWGEAAQASWGWLVVERIPLLALSAGDAWLTVFASRAYGSMRLKLPLGARIENAIYSYALYLWKGIWPAKLAVFYPHPGTGLAGWKVTLAAAFLVALSLVVWLRRREQPYLVTGWLWYLGTLVPAIGLVQVGEQAMADRYAYIPLMGIFVMAVWSAADWADGRQITFATRAKVAAVVLVYFALFAGDQIRYWKSADVLWLHAVNVTKNNFTAEQDLSAAYMMTDRSEEALPYLEDAVRLRPGDPGAHLNLAGAYALSHRAPEAIQQYELGIPLEKDRRTLAGPYETLGRLYERQGNYAKAIPSYEQSLQIDPQRADLRQRLARAEFSAAIRDVAEQPSGENYLRLGQLMQREGRISDARTAYQKALKLDPKLSDARTALAELNKGGR